MRVTTIIPTIGRDSLDCAVNSVLSQNIEGNRQEVIVVNDSGVALLPAAWQTDSRVKIFVTNRQERCVARNTGIAAAAGDWLHFLDDDDYLLASGLKNLLEGANNPDAVVVTGGYEVEQPGVNTWVVPASGIEGNRFALFVAGENVPLGASLIKRDTFLNHVKEFDSKTIAFEDRDVICRISMYGKIIAVPHTVVHYKLPGSNGSTSDFARSGKRSNRLIREKALSMKGSLQALNISIGTDDILRGRICKQYVFSGIINFLSLNWVVSIKRLVCALRIAYAKLFVKKFWEGFFRDMKFIHER